MFLIYETFRYLFSRKSLTFFVIASTFLLFSILGITILFTYQSFQYLNKVKKEIRIQAYLKQNLNSLDSIKILTILNSISGIEEIYYKSNRQAYEELINNYREYKDVFSSIDINELPNSYIIKPKIYWTKSLLLEEISKKIKMIDGIEDVYYGKEWIVSLEKISNAFILISIFVVIIIFLTFIFISSYAVKIAINDHKLAIEILKLSGISYFKIYFPFRLMGILYGLIPSILTFIFLNAFIFILKLFNFKLFPFPNAFLFLIVIFGVLVGFLSSENALRENS
jgi:cell division transport system permease protein